MGGAGSGRRLQWEASLLTTDLLALDIRQLNKRGLLEPGNRFSWQWSAAGKQIASIQIVTKAEKLRLHYRSRKQGRDWEPMDYHVPLLSQPCNFGGARKWFACPVVGCGNRVGILHGGRVFACRTCNGLSYPSQRERGYQRFYRKAEKIRERLGWETGLDAPMGQKPKGMHWKTYHRLISELRFWEGRFHFAFHKVYGSPT